MKTEELFMKKKIIAIVLSLMLVLSITGCGKKDPIERLKTSFEKSMAMESASQSFDMDVFIDFSEVTPEMEMVKNMLNGMKITGTMDMNQKDMSFAGKMKFDLNGMAYEMELYRGEEYFIKTPFSSKYVIISDKEEAAELFDTEFITGFGKDMNDLIFSKLSDKNTTAKEDITIEQNGESVKVTPISVTLTEEEAKAVFKEIMEFMLNSPEFTNQMKSNMKKEIEALEGEKTEEEIDEIYNTAVAEMDNVFKAVNEGISLKKMDFTYYLDKKDDIRKSDIDYVMDMDMQKLVQASMAENEDAEMPAEMNIPVISIQLKGTSDIYNINKLQEIVIPEINEENSVGIEGMMGMPVQ